MAAEQPRDYEVFTITSASRGLSEQQPDRTKRYLISMAIRTGCVIAAIFTPGWLRWAFIAGAVTLPYFAVVLANGGRENDEPGELGVRPGPGRELGPGADPEGPRLTSA